MPGIWNIRSRVRRLATTIKQCQHDPTDEAANLLPALRCRLPLVSVFSSSAFPLAPEQRPVFIGPRFGLFDLLRQPSKFFAVALLLCKLGARYDLGRGDCTPERGGVAHAD